MTCHRVQEMRYYLTRLTLDKKGKHYFLMSKAISRFLAIHIIVQLRYTFLIFAQQISWRFIVVLNLSFMLNLCTDSVVSSLIKFKYCLNFVHFLCPFACIGAGKEKLTEKRNQVEFPRILKTLVGIFWAYFRSWKAHGFLVLARDFFLKIEVNLTCNQLFLKKQTKDGNKRNELFDKITETS